MVEVHPVDASGLRREKHYWDRFLKTRRKFFKINYQPQLVQDPDFWTINSTLGVADFSQKFQDFSHQDLVTWDPTDQRFQPIHLHLSHEAIASWEGDTHWELKVELFCEKMTKTHTHTHTILVQGAPSEPIVVINGINGVITLHITSRGPPCRALPHQQVPAKLFCFGGRLDFQC